MTSTILQEQNSRISTLKHTQLSLKQIPNLWALSGGDNICYQETKSGGTLQDLIVLLRNWNLQQDLLALPFTLCLYKYSRLVHVHTYWKDDLYKGKSVRLGCGNYWSITLLSVPDIEGKKALTSLSSTPWVDVHSKTNDATCGPNSCRSESTRSNRSGSRSRCYNQPK